jgi:hypothetical protein
MNDVAVQSMTVPVSGQWPWANRQFLQRTTWLFFTKVRVETHYRYHMVLRSCRQFIHTWGCKLAL